MSGSITFVRGPFRGWHVDVFPAWHEGQLARVTVSIETPDRDYSGLLAFGPGIDGFEQAAAAESGGPREKADLLEWIIEATRTALAERADITPDHAAHWTAIIEIADRTRAEFFTRYPDGKVPPFEVVAELLVQA